jgi:hypothetical protein
MANNPDINDTDTDTDTGTKTGTGDDTESDADTASFYKTMAEQCERCERETTHHVTIDVRVESERYGGKQPHRISECQVCGLTVDDRIGIG